MGKPPRLPISLLPARLQAPLQRLQGFLLPLAATRHQPQCHANLSKPFGCCVASACNCL